MYIASNGMKTAVILQDSDPLNPRTDYDNLGTMVCWHNRYNLGDKHDFRDPFDFALAMVKEHVPFKDFIQAIQRNEVSNLYLGDMGDYYHVMSKVHNPLNNSSTWGHTSITMNKDLELLEGRDEESTMEDLCDFASARELVDLCNKINHVAILPLYLFDHSGLTISTSDFNDPWDSGQVGYIYLDKETAMKEIAMPAETLRIAKMIPEEQAESIHYNRPAWMGFDEVLKNNGFLPVMHGDLIKNLHDPALGGSEEKPLIDKTQLLVGAVFKKDHKLYLFEGYREDGSFTMKPLATFNPDLKPLTEETWRGRAGEILKGEVSTYDNYLRGEVYGYQLYEGLEEVESCWGFNPGKENIRDLMKDELFGWLEKGMRFDYSSGDNFDIDDYYAETDFPQLRETITKQVVTQLYEDFQIQVPFPYGMSFTDIRANKDCVLDSIVESLYEKHDTATSESIREAIFEHAGVARSLQPKISVMDLDPEREYTAEEIHEIFNKKPSLAEMIAGAAARQVTQPNGLDHEIHDKFR